MNHLECVTAQRNQWYWYLLILFLSFLISNTLGTIPYMAVLVWNILRSGGLQNMPEVLSGGNLSFLTEGIDSNLMLFVMLFAFVILLVAGAYLIQQLQGRTWRMVVNGTQRVRWSHFFGGFAVWGVINLVSMAVGYVTDPGNFEFRFDAARFIPLVLVAVTMIPIQSASEEFFFRGYLAQGVASWTGSRWWAHARGQPGGRPVWFLGDDAAIHPHGGSLRIGGVARRRHRGGDGGARGQQPLRRPADHV